MTLQGRDAALTRRRALLAGAALLTTAACAKARPQTDLVRIGYQKNGVLLLAKQRGGIIAALSRAGVRRVDWVEFQSGPPLLEALAIGSIDMGSSGDTPPIFAQAGGAPIVYVAAQRLSGAAGGVLTPAGSSLQSLNDLKGRKLCFTRGSSAHNSAIVALESVGLTLDDVEQVNLSPADAAAAFSQGGIDGWVIWDPYYTLAIRDQNARALVTLAQLGGGQAFFFANRTFAAERADTVRAVLDFLRAEGRWAEANRDAAAEIIARETNMSLDLIKDTTQRADFAIGPMTPDAIAMQQTVADRFATQGVIPSSIKIADATWTGWSPA